MESRAAPKQEGSSDCPHPDRLRSSSRPLEGHAAPSLCTCRAMTCPTLALGSAGLGPPELPSGGQGPSTRRQPAGQEHPSAVGRVVAGSRRGCHLTVGLGRDPGLPGPPWGSVLEENPSPDPHRPCTGAQPARPAARDSPQGPRAGDADRIGEGLQGRWATDFIWGQEETGARPGRGGPRGVGPMGEGAPLTL